MYIFFMNEELLICVCLYIYIYIYIYTHDRIIYGVHQGQNQVLELGGQLYAAISTFDSTILSLRIFV